MGTRWCLTYNAYCITPSFFSWLGRGTSRRGLPVMLSGGPSSTVCDGWMAVADLVDEEDMDATEPARNGKRAIVGLATGPVRHWWRSGFEKP